MGQACLPMSQTPYLFLQNICCGWSSQGTSSGVLMFVQAAKASGDWAPLTLEQKHGVITDGLVFHATSCMQPSGGLHGCCCLRRLLPPPLLDNEPLALSCCQSGRQTGLCSGHCRLLPSGPVWVARTATLPAEGHGRRSRTHWTTDRLLFGPKYLWKEITNTRLPLENDSWRFSEGDLAFVATF